VRKLLHALGDLPEDALSTSTDLTLDPVLQTANGRSDIVIIHGSSEAPFERSEQRKQRDADDLGDGENSSARDIQHPRSLAELPRAGPICSNRGAVGTSPVADE
jgi:hypothetical protein